MPANSSSFLNLSLIRGGILWIFCLSYCFAWSGPGNKGDTPTSSNTVLFEALALQDKLLFEAFNNCDLKTLETFMAPEIAFYHDQAPPQITASEVMKSAVDRCGRHFFLRRELVAGSVEVQPLHGGHALQTGTHRFYQKDPTGKEFLAAQAHFIHLWEKKDSGWQVIHVVSYDHQSPQAEN